MPDRTNLSNGSYQLPYIHGPAFFNDSTGIFKTFPMREGRSLEIRGEAFNLFNHPWNEFIADDTNMYMGFLCNRRANQLDRSGYRRQQDRPSRDSIGGEVLFLGC